MVQGRRAAGAFQRAGARQARAAPRRSREGLSVASVRAQAYAGRSDPALEGGARTWSEAYRALAAGDFHGAEASARTLLDDPTWAGPARITLGSVLRHLERHADALVVDEGARALATSPAARAEAWVSMAADAVGAGDEAACRQRLASAARLTDADDRRGLIRLSWVRTEHALLTDDPASATGHARLALADARALAWPRHVAKSLLFLGASLFVAGSREATARLTEAVERADAIGARPIREAASGLLARAR